jgi:membrane carboxypeptidase/penicillin-binding protein PbpC
LRTCALHQPGAGAGAITEVWPATARHWDLAHPVIVRPAGDLAESLVPSNSAPAAPSSTAGATGDNRNDTNGDVLRGLRIITPATQSEFMLTGAPGADRVRLATSLDATTALHWYLNEQYLGASTPQHPLLLPLSVGHHQLTCVTPTGLSDQVAFTVATLN